MHSANLSTSDRLKRVAAILADGREHSTLDIIKKADVCAVNSIISELRANGGNISCRCEGRVWYYKMEVNNVQVQ